MCPSGVKGFWEVGPELGEIPPLRVWMVPGSGSSKLLGFVGCF